MYTNHTKKGSLPDMDIEPGAIRDKELQSEIPTVVDHSNPGGSPKSHALCIHVLF